MIKHTIVITGSGTGLGKMAAIALAKRGHKVYATTKYENEACLLNEYAKKSKLNLESFKLDITLEEDRNKLLKVDFDTLINNAAIGDSGSVSEIDINRLKNVFEVNVFSNILITQTALKKMIPKGTGKIIFLSSLAGKISVPFLSPYCSSKFAIEGFVNSLRQELLILKNVDIKICLIEPGAFATGFNKENNDKKYSWMKNASYFKPQIEKIKYYEEKFWNFVETSKFEKIIKEYIKAVENNRPKFRYFAPFSQWFIVKICTILGL